jgi:site-specific DNA recombinase
MADTGGERRAVIYTRVSSKEQVDGYSLDTQERFCREYADRHGYRVDKVFTERGESAKTALRPELQSMLTYMAKNRKHLSALVVYRVDRLSRDMIDYGNLVVMMRDLGIQLLSTGEDLNETPQGQFRGNFAACLAQLDNEERGVRCRNGMIAAVEAGRCCWHAPLGYVNGRRAKNRPSFELGEPHTVVLVRKSFELIDGGCTVAEAHRQVTEEGLRSRKGSSVSLSTFCAMLRNKTYAGLVSCFDKCVRGEFDPIVPEDLFYRVQSRLRRSSPTSVAVYQKVNPEFPLRGSVRCPHCGHLLTGGKSTGNGGKYGYYSCAKCGKTRIRREKVEQAFVPTLSGLSLDGKYVDALSVAIDANLEEQRSWMKRETTKLQTQIKGLDARKSGIVDKNIGGVIPDDMAKEFLAKAAREQEDLKCSLASIASSILTTPDVAKKGLAVLQDMGSFWEESDLTTKRRFQRFVFPEGIAVSESGFGTAPIASCLEEKERSKAVENGMVEVARVELASKYAKSSVTTGLVVYWV